MLSPYRVLDLTDHGALICGQILGDLGADVIVAEPPGGAAARREGPFAGGQAGPNTSLAWWANNRNKRAITLDLETDAGRARLKRLAAHVDVVVESFAPGYLGAHGVGYDALTAINPALVVVSITPFGQTGPKADWAASDLTLFAASGPMAMTGDDDRAPCAITVPQAWLHAGAEGAVGALIALTGAIRDGVGQHVDVSVQTAAMMATQATVLSAAWGENETKRMAGGVNFGGIPLKFVNPAKDGYVSVTFLFGTAIGPFTQRLMALMCERGIVDEATRDKDWINYTGLLMSGQEPLSELLRCISAIAEFTSGFTKDELFEMASEHDLLIVPVATLDEVAHSEQLADRDYFQDVPHPELGRSVRYPGPHAKLSEAPVLYRRRPPLLGEHDAEVDAEIAVAPARPRPADAPASRELPLAGIRVLDIMWVVAGPWGTRYLADYGATVIKVDSPRRVDTARTVGPFKDHVPGAERSGLYATINAGKLGITLNLGCPEGRALMLKLAAWADVVTESFAPGALVRMGVGYEDICAVNPDVIMISSCLNGQTGPHATLAGFGTMGLHIAGFGELAGWPDRAPASPAGAYTDYIAPKFIATTVLAALEYRRRTGKGQYIDLSQGEAAIHFLGPAMLDYFVNGNVPVRRGNASPDYSPHGVYPLAGDDQWIAIAVTAEHQWQALLRTTHMPELADDARFVTMAGRVAHHHDLDAIVATWTAGRTAAEAEAALQMAGVPVHRVAGSPDLIADPQLAARGHFATVPHGELGDVVVETSRMRFSATPSVVTRAGPTLGQDNDRVLHEILGLSDDEVTELLMAGALE